MALISEIQRFSINDGPGIRTTVFFKGCPLKCRWCHNPECISFEQQIMYYPEKCIRCGKCDEGCYSGARVVCGREMSTQEIMKEIMQDKPYYNPGGVTFSGGEPLAQAKTVSELVDCCHRENVTTAIETSLIFFEEEILKNIDFIMADLKIMDEKKHIEYTGVSNKEIIENFRRLDALNKPFVMRTPIIDKITDLEAIEDFASTLKNLQKHEKLNYHSLGVEKAAALGIHQERFD